MDDALVAGLRAHAGSRLVAVPARDGDVQAALARLKKLIGAVAARGPNVPAGATRSWAKPRGHGSAVGRRGDCASQPVTADGRGELVPLKWAVIERSELIVLGLAVKAVGRAWGLGGDEVLNDAVVDVAEAHGMKNP